MTETWVYQAANTIEIAGDLTAKYWPNQLIKITQGAEKFFVVMTVALVGGNTRLTVSGGGVYTLTSGAITAHRMTTNAAPVGLPSGFAEQGRAYAAYTPDVPVDTDRVGLWNGAANYVQKIITWANLKATLETYFDTLYALSGHNHAGTYAPAANGVTNGDSHDHSGGDGAQIDHGGLGGLADDDHTAYARLAGRAGSQTFEGDTAAGGNITISSTHHSSKGSVIVPCGTISANTKLRAIVLDAVYAQALTSLNEIAWRYAGQSGFPLRIAGMFGDATHMDLAFFTGTYNVDGVEALRLSGADQKATFAADIYVTGNCSALSFTDRTEAFVGDALEAIRKIAADESGLIDHSTLPEFVQSTKIIADAEGIESKITERNIGNMVSVLTVGVQQLTQELEKRDTVIADLSARLEMLEGSSGQITALPKRVI